MNILLNDIEIRVLGCLLEKAMATPDYYPLSLNSLTNACNQKSNRSPVVAYDEETVLSALKCLQEKKLVRQSNVSRVPKYEQLFSEQINLISREQAVVCVLLVRGPQTIGEIRSRTERLYRFAGLDEVQGTVSSLEDMKLICKLARQPGRKESRYMHLFGGEQPETAAENPLPIDVSLGDGRSAEPNSTAGRIAELEEQVEQLHREMRDLRLEFASFKAQFE